MLSSECLLNKFKQSIDFFAKLLEDFKCNSDLKGAEWMFSKVPLFPQHGSLWGI